MTQLSSPFAENSTPQTSLAFDKLWDLSVSNAGGMLAHQEQISSPAAQRTVR